MDDVWTTKKKKRWQYASIEGSPPKQWKLSSSILPNVIFFIASTPRVHRVIVLPQECRPDAVGSNHGPPPKKIREEYCSPINVEMFPFRDIGNKNVINGPGIDHESPE